MRSKLVQGMSQLPPSIDPVFKDVFIHIRTFTHIACQLEFRLSQSATEGEGLCPFMDMREHQSVSTSMVCIVMKIQNIILPILVTALAPAGLSAHCGACGMDSDEHKHEASAQMDIVETAVADGSFSTLATALQSAGLVETLKGDGPFTVFAPTDEAFAKLPEGTVESLLKPENRDKLVSILTYHVVPEKVKAEQVVDLDSATSAEGSDLKIKTKDGTVYINEATVVKTDIAASNGVIHVIDSVLMP